MRCVICSSIVEKQDPTNRIQCDTTGCGVFLCSEVYGAECWATHNKKEHPEKGSMTTGAVRTLIHELRAKLKAAEDRAVVAEGAVSHWKEVDRQGRLNAAARFWGALKWLRVMDLAKFNAMWEAGLFSKDDILE